MLDASMAVVPPERAAREASVEVVGFPVEEPKLR